VHLVGFIIEIYHDARSHERQIRLTLLPKHGGKLNLGLICNMMHKILIYLHIIHLLKSSTCFDHYFAHLQEVYLVIVYMHPLVLSLSAGDCLVDRLRRNSFLTGAQESHLQRVTLPEAAYIQLRCRPPEDEQSNARNM